MKEADLDKDGHDDATEQAAHQALKKLTGDVPGEEGEATGEASGTWLVSWPAPAKKNLRIPKSEASTAVEAVEYAVLYVINHPEYNEEYKQHFVKYNADAKAGVTDASTGTRTEAEVSQKFLEDLDDGKFGTAYAHSPLMESRRKHLKEGMRSHMQTEAGDTPRSVAAAIEAWMEEEAIDSSGKEAIAAKIAEALQDAGVRDDYIADWEDAVYNWLDLETPAAEESEEATDVQYAANNLLSIITRQDNRRGFAHRALKAVLYSIAENAGDETKAAIGTAAQEIDEFIKARPWYLDPDAPRREDRA